ncbi:MAG TPA: 50S ribosomal protein L13 [Candidatus Atribacteria bacterium]|nr:50S ribosomal protein L13 [Candidatus Atribacteria bacterium]
MKTYVPKKEEIKRKWYVIDATGKPLGRLATQVANILRGKHKPIYTPFIDTGDYVIIVNAEKVVLTGNKEEQKVYYRHSGYPGGIKKIPYKKMKEKFPERVIKIAVKGMIPHNSMGRKMLRKLKVYKGEKHPHEAQMPELIK